MEVYWFDDTGTGQCRVPAECRLEYRDGGAWTPVPDVPAVGVEKDQFNSVAFRPVTTDALRLAVKLREGASGGVLEWRASER